MTFGSYSANFTRVNMQVLHWHEKNEIHQQRYKDGITSTVLDFRLLSTALLKAQCPMSVLRSFHDSATNLEELTRDEIESKMVIEACDIDVESKAESGFGASEHPPCPHCGRLPIIHLKKAGSDILTRDSKDKGYKKDSDKSEGAGATMKHLLQDLTRPNMVRHLYRCILHIPGLDRNLVSVTQLTSKGLTIRMLKNKCVISGKQRHVITVKESGSFYSINCYSAYGNEIEQQG